MYLPPQFKAKDLTQASQLIREHPFASLISNDDAGMPFVSHLPLHLVEQDGCWVLLGHLAKPNPQWRHLQVRPQAVVTFMGPHGYLSPSVYPDLARVPTWNYLAVHCTVEATLLEKPEAKDALLKKIIGDHEPAYAAQWRSLDTSYVQKMLSGIVAFELSITGLECKLKLNQHRPESHAAMRAAYATGNPQEQALGRWMDYLGLS